MKHESAQGGFSLHCAQALHLFHLHFVDHYVGIDGGKIMMSNMYIYMPSEVQYVGQAMDDVKLGMY